MVGCNGIFIFMKEEEYKNMMNGKFKDGNKQRVKILDFICDY
jgi:hypothetical protein